MSRVSRVVATLVAVETYTVLVLLLLAGTGDFGQGRELLRVLIDGVAFEVAFAGFPVVGWTIVVRRPDNRIGWVVLLIGATLYNGVGAMELADRGFRSGALGDGLLGLVSMGNALLPALVIGLFTSFLVLFPDGQPDAGGRRLVRSSAVLAVVVAVSRLLRPGRLDLSADVDVDNSFGVQALQWLDGVVGVSTLGLTVVAVVAFGRLVRHYRRADQVVRKQVQWVIAPLGAFALLFAAGVALSETGLGTDLQSSAVIMSGFVVGFVGMAAGIGVAVFRYRLFELDRLVSRTAAYALTVVVLLGVYAGSVLGLGAVARSITGERGSAVVAVSTLIVAAAFRPLAGRVRGQVERRFNRARYDAQLELASLADRMRREVELTSIAAELTNTVDRVVRPSSVSLVLLDQAVAP